MLVLAPSSQAYFGFNGVRNNNTSFSLSLNPLFITPEPTGNFQFQYVLNEGKGNSLIKLLFSFSLQKSKYLNYALIYLKYENIPKIY